MRKELPNSYNNNNNHKEDEANDGVPGPGKDRRRCSIGSEVVTCSLCAGYICILYMIYS